MAINCDITDGRTLPECTDERAGVKTVFFYRHSQLDVQKNLAGEIISIGTGTLYRFEQDDMHGLALQEVARGNGETEWIKLQIDMTCFYVTADFLYTINVLKRGSWAIFFLDYDDNIRLMGEQTSMLNAQGVTSSGVGPGDTKYTNLTFIGDAQDYAPFVLAFEECPFDNFDNAVVPEYVNCDNALLWNDTEKILWDATEHIIYK